MSSWWQWYDPAKRVPGYVPPRDDPATDRAGTAFMLGAVAFFVFLGSLLIALFTRNWSVALWLMAGSFGLGGLSALLMPKAKRPPRP